MKSFLFTGMLNCMRSSHQCRFVRPRTADLVILVTLVCGLSSYASGQSEPIDITRSGSNVDPHGTTPPNSNVTKLLPKVVQFAQVTGASVEYQDSSGKINSISFDDISCSDWQRFKIQAKGMDLDALLFEHRFPYLRLRSTEINEKLVAAECLLRQAPNDASITIDEIISSAEELISYPRRDEFRLRFFNPRYFEIRMPRIDCKRKLKAVSLDEKGERLGIVYFNGDSEIWDVLTGWKLLTLKQDCNLAAKQIVFAKSNVAFVVDTDGSVHRIDSLSGRIIERVDLSGARVKHLWASNNSSDFAAITDDNKYVTTDATQIHTTEQLATNIRIPYQFAPNHNIDKLAYVSDGGHEVFLRRGDHIHPALLEDVRVLHVQTNHDTVFVSNRHQHFFLSPPRIDGKVWTSVSIPARGFVSPPLRVFYCQNLRQWLLIETSGMVRRVDDDAPSVDSQYENMCAANLKQVEMSRDGKRFAFVTNNNRVRVFAYPFRWPQAKLEIVRLLIRLIMDDQFDRAQEAVARLVARPSRLPRTSDPRDVWLASALLSSTWRPHEYEDRVTAIEKWIDGCGEWAFTKNLEVDLLIHKAWRARGDVFASQVTEEGWEGFNRHLLQAQELLSPMLEQERPHYRAFENYFRVAQGLGINEKDWRRRQQQMRQLYPKFAAGHKSIMRLLLPRWGGKIGEMQEYASSVADSVGGIKGDLLYGRLVTSLINFSADDPSFFYENRFNYQRLLSAAQATAQLDAFAPTITHYAAYLAWNRNDVSAKPILRKTTSHYRVAPFELSVWYKQKYPRYLEWVKNKD